MNFPHSSPRLKPGASCGALVKAGVAEASDGGHLGLLFFSQVLTRPLLPVRTNSYRYGKDFLAQENGLC